MKNRYSNDERVIRSNGQVSRIRTIIIEALEAQGSKGATPDEIAALVGMDIGGKRPKGSIGQALSYMQADDVVYANLGRWYLKENIPDIESVVDPYSANTNGFSAKIAPITQKRKGITIEVYTSPRVYEQAIDIALLIGGRWWPVPLFGNARICIGQSRPEWPPYERYYTDVEVVKIITQGGKVSEERPAPRDIVTIDTAE